MAKLATRSEKLVASRPNPVALATPQVTMSSPVFVMESFHWVERVSLIWRMPTVIYMIFLYHLGDLQDIQTLFVSSIGPALSENSGQVSFFNQAMKTETVREMNNCACFMLFVVHVITGIKKLLLSVLFHINKLCYVTMILFCLLSLWILFIQLCN